MVKNLEILESFKNSAEVKKEGGKIKLVFSKSVHIAENERNREFEFRVPTLEDIEIALSSAEEESEELRQMKQTYYLISSQFSPKIVPNDIPKYMKIEEMKAFSEVLAPFLS